MCAENSKWCRPKSKCLTTTAIMLDGMKKKKHIIQTIELSNAFAHTFFSPPRALFFFRPMFGKPSCLLVSSYYFSCARCDDYYYYKYKHVPFQRVPLLQACCARYECVCLCVCAVHVCQLLWSICLCTNQKITTISDFDWDHVKKCGDLFIQRLKFTARVEHNRST